MTESFSPFAKSLIRTGDDPKRVEDGVVAKSEERCQ